MMKELSMHIMDITQNSVRGQAKHVTIKVEEDLINNIFSFSVEDDGIGMSEEFLESVRDPFRTSRTTRKVGLGIPFLQQTCNQCGGELILTSESGKGTYIKAVMEYDNIDRPPLGDLENSIFLLIVMNPGVIFKFIHVHNGLEYELDMAEVMEVLGDVSLETPEVSQWLKDNIIEGIESVRNP